jgi:hypothetical protein
MFPKFIKVSSYMRFHKIAKSTTGDIATEFKLNPEQFTELDIYVLLSSITEFFYNESKSEWHVTVSDPVRPMYGIVRDPIQMAIIERYVNTAHMDSNHDIITAICDMKEFMGHLATVTTNQKEEESLKRKRDV